MDDVERLKGEVRAIARSIASGEISERSGAARIWVLLAEAGYPEELHEARVAFVGPVSELQDDPEHTEAHEADIREAAERFAERF